MGFNSVYQALKELFPQVDARLLKAVAIEHSKDPDAAVDSVLTDVLPFIGDKSSVLTFAVVNKGKAVEVSETIDEDNANASGLWNNEVHNFDNDSLSSSFYDAKDTDELLNGNSKNDELLTLRCEEGTGSEEGEKLSTPRGQDQFCEHSCDQELVVHDVVCAASSQDGESDSLVMKAFVSSSSVVSGEDGCTNVGSGNSGDVELGCTNDVSAFNPKVASSVVCLVEKQFASQNLAECEIPAGSGSKDQLQVGLSLEMPLETENGTNLANDILDFSSFTDPDFAIEFPQTGAVAVDSEGRTLSSTIVTRSGQICRVNLLEDIIEETRNYKDTVFSAMESVLRLMEEVELQEKEAEQVKVAAYRGGFDILEKVEEIKRMLKHAKEANELHAGEVYGEKSILATEVRELQARLLGLSDEKDKALSTLDKMKISLEERLAIAEQQRRAAELELCDKQAKAQEALAEQELIMDKVVQESKVLQQDAEENAKLRDFLMEKGRLVDVLQGEISVICQDVKSLKEIFDNHGNSKSLAIDQTSCRLASSNSSVKSIASLKSTASLDRTASLKSVASLYRAASLKSTTSSKSSISDPITEQMDLPESPVRMSQASSVDCQSPKKSYSEHETIRHEATPQKPLMDDDWELCDLNL